MQNFGLKIRYLIRYNVQKLDGIGPVDNRPSTDKLHRFVKKKNCDQWHMTCDMWHTTCDTQHATHNMRHVVGGEHSLKFQLPSSYGLWFMISWRLGGKGWPTELINESMNYEAVYRTAPGTPGPLKTRNVIKKLTSNPQVAIFYRSFIILCAKLCLRMLKIQNKIILIIWGKYTTGLVLHQCPQWIDYHDWTSLCYTSL